MVCGGNRSKATLPGDLFKKPVAFPAGAILYIPLFLGPEIYCYFREMALDIMFLTKIVDKMRIASGIGSQVVVYVSDHRSDLQFFPCFEKKMEHRHRIESARNGKKNALTKKKGKPLFNVAEKAILRGFMMTICVTHFL